METGQRDSTREKVKRHSAGPTAQGCGIYLVPVVRSIVVPPPPPFSAVGVAYDWIGFELCRGNTDMSATWSVVGGPAICQRRAPPPHSQTRWG